MSTEAHFDLATRLSARLAHLGEDYCIFTRSGRDYAISVTAAREVLTGEPATPVPQAPPSLIGVINLRGEVLPLVQLDSLLDMPARPYTPGDQILVLTCGEVDIGLAVDRVRDVRSIDAGEMQDYPSGPAANPLSRRYWPAATGVVTVLDADKLVAEAVNVVSARFQQRLPGRADEAAPIGRAVPLSNK
ncbi:MAG: purine-binding chemotaxis protein CheW [Deltaproteobacteria bacterium]|nr:purine-binding chemotaxis protein CheW [Deltaproteobacteria bacterium]